MVAGRTPTRQDDELLLSQMERRFDGEGVGFLAREAGISSSALRTKMMRVKQADERESGEDVEGFYW